MNMGFGSLIVKEKNAKQGCGHVCRHPGLVLDQGGVEPLCVSRPPGQEPAPLQPGRVLGQTVRPPDVVVFIVLGSKFP